MKKLLIAVLILSIPVLSSADECLEECSGVIPPGQYLAAMCAWYGEDTGEPFLCEAGDNCYCQQGYVDFTEPTELTVSYACSWGVEWALWWVSSGVGIVSICYPPIFVDGFETGDVSEWSYSEGVE